MVAAEAEVTRDEAALLHGVFSLGDTEVHEVMVPRVDIVGVEVDTPWSEVVDRVRSSEHSRFPVYEETLDEIVGVLYAKDLLPGDLADEEPAGMALRSPAPAVFIPAHQDHRRPAARLPRHQTHIAIVADEFGGTAGLVTIEDVLEEIVGEIRDEYDEEEPEVVAEEESRFWVGGRVTLDELCELLGSGLRARRGSPPSAGFVYEQLGRVPRPGESFTVGAYRVIVERVVRRKVERVYFERQDEPAAGGRDMSVGLVIAFSVLIVAWLTASATAVRTREPHLAAALGRARCARRVPRSTRTWNARSGSCSPPARRSR